MVRISTDAELMQVGLSPKQTNLLGGKRGFFPLVCKQSKIQSEWASGPVGQVEKMLAVMWGKPRFFPQPQLPASKSDLPGLLKFFWRKPRFFPRESDFDIQKKKCWVRPLISVDIIEERKEKIKNKFFMAKISAKPR